MHCIISNHMLVILERKHRKYMALLYKTFHTAISAPQIGYKQRMSLPDRHSTDILVIFVLYL